MADIRSQVARVKDTANDIADNASTKIKDTRDHAADALRNGKDRANDVYDDVRGRTDRVAVRANEIIHDHPILTVAGAVAIGAAVAWMFPKSRAAMRTLPALATTAGSKLVEAALAARSVASEQLDHAKDTAEHAYHVARDTAVDAASTARDKAASADLGGIANKFANDVMTVVADKADAVSEAIKSRLPKK